MIIGIDSVIKTYTYFYSHKYNSPKYKFKPTSQAIVKIHQFLAILDKEYSLPCIGKVFLTNYFLFQFQRTKDQVFNRFASRNQSGGVKVGGRIQIYDIIGKKAFKYWKERDIDYDWILQNSNLTREWNINLNDVHELIEYKQSIEASAILKSEEIEKRRFYNTVRGLIVCLERTSLFNSKSKACVFCYNKRFCKTVLKQNYPRIYQERGYENN